MVCQVLLENVWSSSHLFANIQPRTISLNGAPFSVASRSLWPSPRSVNLKRNSLAWSAARFVPKEAGNLTIYHSAKKIADG